jgi:hypothetical protein
MCFYMCVYVIMLIFVCILCYHVYSVKSSRELVFIVIQKSNSNKVFLSYLILSYLTVNWLMHPSFCSHYILHDCHSNNNQQDDTYDWTVIESKEHNTN